MQFRGAAADPGVAAVTVSEDGRVTVRGLRLGHTTVTVTASNTADSGGDLRVSQTFVVTVRGPVLVSLFPSAVDPAREGFVRIINHSTDGGEVRIAGIDDAGGRSDLVTLRVDANTAAHFNSNDLENGNAEKGLSGATGAPASGDWRLEVDSDMEIEVLHYIRTKDGFLTAMHDTAPVMADKHHVAIFNPGSNDRQQSRLRLINPGGEAVAITITGIDDVGEAPGDGVTLSVPAGLSRTLTAAQLESGEGLQGALGDGAGGWRLSASKRSSRSS